MTNEELREGIVDIYIDWDNGTISNYDEKTQALINQFKSDVEEERCKQCTFSFNKKGGYYHDVEDYYKD